MIELLKNIFSLRMFKYYIIFLVISCMYNYMSYAIRRKLEIKYFDGIIKFYKFEIHTSYIFILILTLLSSSLYKYSPLQKELDKLFFATEQTETFNINDNLIMGSIVG